MPQKNNKKLISISCFSSGERASLNDRGGINLARYMFALRFCKEKSVLELGCGLGYGAYFLAKNGVARILAYDANKKAISFAEERYGHPKITYKLGSIENIDPGGNFDVVIAYELIEHLKNPKKLLLLVKKTLKKGGIFLISTPNRFMSLYDQGKPSNPFHEKEYYPEGFQDLLRGFFKKVDLYGIFLKEGKKIQEKSVQSTWRWKLTSFLVRKRWIRRIVNYLPEKPKRIFTGEIRLEFKTEDFNFLRAKANNAPYMMAVCRR